MCCRNKICSDVSSKESCQKLHSKIALKKSTFNSASDFDLRKQKNVRLAHMPITQCNQRKQRKILALGIQLHLLNPHLVLGNLYIRSLYEKMAKQQSSLVNFFSKRARNEGELVIFFIQKCSKVN